MRKKTSKEKEVLGKIEYVLRQLYVSRDTVGYVPLLDAIAYTYAFPEKGILEAMEVLEKENYYLGVYPTDSKTAEDDAKLYPTIVHTVKTAIDSKNKSYLRTLQLDRMKVILDGKRGYELEEVLLAEIGEKYVQYSNDEKIVLFFIKKILKAIKKQGVAWITLHPSPWQNHFYIILYKYN